MRFKLKSKEDIAMEWFVKERAKLDKITNNCLKLGETKKVTKFAFFPIRIDDHLVWFEKYINTYVFSKTNNSLMGYERYDEFFWKLEQTNFYDKI